MAKLTRSLLNFSNTLFKQFDWIKGPNLSKIKINWDSKYSVSSDFYIFFSVLTTDLFFFIIRAFMNVTVNQSFRKTISKN